MRHRSLPYRTLRATLTHLPRITNIEVFPRAADGDEEVREYGSRSYKSAQLSMGKSLLVRLVKGERGTIYADALINVGELPFSFSSAPKGVR